MKKRKKFFFEKKNQKTFAPLRAVFETPGTETNKVFLLLFVHKKKFFPSLPQLKKYFSWAIIPSLPRNPARDTACPHDLPP
jgi:hypothetical protein